MNVVGTCPTPAVPAALAAAAGDGAARGGYVLAEALDADPGAAAPDVVLVAAGGEVPAALDARRILQREGIATRVVSMPCAAWFRQQSRAYRDAVLPPGAPATVSVGAGAAVGRYQLLGEAGGSVDTGGTGENAVLASCGHGLFDHDGLTAERVAATARATLARAAGAARAGERGRL
ncbi:transketolase C-terminal domain-containing protein [Streptomyces roseoverticillatus]|uniref:transketolase-like TK C-terminal-containing protein n=1 Tax=Streptomyces roseoverticillatus TaxID=66429 RepID=UPI0033DD122F